MLICSPADKHDSARGFEGSLLHKTRSVNYHQDTNTATWYFSDFVYPTKLLEMQKYSHPRQCRKPQLLIGNAADYLQCFTTKHRELSVLPKHSLKVEVLSVEISVVSPNWFRYNHDFHRLYSKLLSCAHKYSLDITTDYFFLPQLIS